ncbi:MAG: hypothetical protein IB618_01925 [Candidatus Pacearchaeota archaeon]|nr:MAG: hypothetical protein IB618_01925 [Candidatus Pacearchaeota archaeon]
MAEKINSQFLGLVNLIANTEKKIVKNLNELGKNVIDCCFHEEIGCWAYRSRRLILELMFQDIDKNKEQPRKGISHKRVMEYFNRIQILYSEGYSKGNFKDDLDHLIEQGIIVCSKKRYNFSEPIRLNHGFRNYLREYVKNTEDM